MPLLKPRFLLCLSLLLCLTLLPSACRQPDLLFLKTEPVTREQTRYYPAIGDSFEIVLPSLGSASLYRWAVKEFDKTALELLRERPGRSEYPENRYPPGYVPHTVFEFKALKVGEFALTFYQMPRLPETPAVTTERTFQVLISRTKATASP
jgi:hypothetical protein